MTSNYFKVRGHGRADEFFFFDDRDAASTESAFTHADLARRPLVKDKVTQLEVLSVYRVPSTRGRWANLPVIGDAV